MAFEPCDCDTPTGNTGIANCILKMKDGKKLLIVNRLNSDGDPFTIPITDLNLAGLTALINETNPLDRIYPTLEMKNVESERADVEKETFDDGSSVIVRDGIRPFQCFFPDGDTIWLGKLGSFACKDIAFYEIDSQNQFIYMKGADPTLAYPFTIAPGTYVTRWMRPTGSTVQKPMIEFEYGTEVNDNNLRVNPASDFTWRDISGLLDANGTYSAITTTTFTLELKDSWGNPVVELTQFEFTIINETTQIPVVITSATETAIGSGIYDFVLAAAQTSGDVLRVALNFTGYSNEGSQIVTIP